MNKAELRALIPRRAKAKAGSLKVGKPKKDNAPVGDLKGEVSS